MEWMGKDLLLREVIVVDDGSTDRTAILASACGFSVVQSDQGGRNRGKGAAFLKGVERALQKGKCLIITFDADMLALSADKIERFFDEISLSAFPMILGDTYKLCGNGVRRCLMTKYNGSRAFKSEIFASLADDMEIWRGATAGFGLEAGLNAFMTSISGNKLFGFGKTEFLAGKLLRASTGDRQAEDAESNTSFVRAAVRMKLASLLALLSHRIACLERLETELPAGSATKG